LLVTNGTCADSADPWSMRTSHSAIVVLRPPGAISAAITSYEMRGQWIVESEAINSCLTKSNLDQLNTFITPPFLSWGVRSHIPSGWRIRYGCQD
jgi:hypothetical protein